jgi:hypothetical protein
MPTNMYTEDFAPADYVRPEVKEAFVGFVARRASTQVSEEAVVQDKVEERDRADDSDGAGGAAFVG